MKTFKENAEKACKVLLHAIPKIAEKDWSDAISKHKVHIKLLFVYMRGCGSVLSTHSVVNHQLV